MNGGAATRAIVSARLKKEGAAIVLAACACALLPFFQARDGTTPVAGAAAFGTIIGIFSCFAQRGTGRLGELELCELSAPLFGRELARATALVPCTIVTIALCAYWLATVALGPTSFSAAVLSFFIANAATLVAICATVRRGFARVLYAVLACAVCAAGLVIEKASAVGALAFCVFVGFVALRQYGEALARYDPIAKSL